MEKTILELQAKVEWYRAEARFWKIVTGFLVVTFALLLVFINGAVRLAEHEAEGVREEQQEMQRITDEVMKGRGVDNRALFPRLKYPAV
jgi:hypothetical protein